MMKRPSRAGDVRYSLADITRTRRDLGYEPAVTFEVGLRDTVRWYLQTSGGAEKNAPQPARRTATAKRS